MLAATNTNLQTSAWGGRQVSLVLTSPLGRPYCTGHEQTGPHSAPHLLLQL